MDTEWQWWDAVLAREAQEPVKPNDNMADAAWLDVPVRDESALPDDQVSGAGALSGRTSTEIVARARDVQPTTGRQGQL